MLALLAGCGGASDPTAPAVAIASVSVSGAAHVEIGKTVQFTAAAVDDADKAVSGATVTWTSSDIAIATVSATGLVTGVSVGEASITATASGKTATRSVTVLPAIASLTISGGVGSQVGATTQLTATARNAAGAVIHGLPIIWTSSDPLAIPVESATGLVTASRIGTATITAAVASASATTPFASNLTPYTFTFPAGTSAADMRIIWDGVQDAHAFHQTVFGRQVTKPVTVMALLTPTGGCTQGLAFASLQTVTFCLGNSGWIQRGPVQRQKIVQHEVFHLWQFEYKWLGNPSLAGAHWVIEGSAELMGFRGVDARGLLTFSTALGCQVKQVADYAPGLPPLSSVETAQTFSGTAGPMYPLAMIAMDQLTSGGGLVALKAYGDAIASGTAWQAAFETSFGMTTSAFYSQFPAYRTGLAVPPQYLCGV
jgi:hypothetical protein